MSCVFWNQVILLSIVVLLMTSTRESTSARVTEKGIVLLSAIRPLREIRLKGLPGIITFSKDKL